jgi:hypothetical protein
VRKLAVTLGGAVAWLIGGHIGLLAILVYVWASAMASTTNTAKTRAVEQRVNNLIVSTGASIGQLNQGIFTDVSGGSTIELVTAQGSVTLHCGALSSFTSGPQTTFLAGLSVMQSPGGVASDGNSGTTWVSGERAQINAWPAAINSILGTAISNGFMNAA